MTAKLPKGGFLFTDKEWEAMLAKCSTIGPTTKINYEPWYQSPRVDGLEARVARLEKKVKALRRKE